MPPRTRYAKSGDIHIAYQQFGDGPLDLVMIPGFVSNLDWLWQLPAADRFMKRLGSFARVLTFDKRGTGLSDRGVGIPTLEERMDDVRAVMDAAGVERAAFLGISEGGPMSMLFAASYPERTDSLVLYGTFARFVATDGYAHAATRDQIQSLIDHLESNWGSGDDLAIFAPSVAGDAEARETWGRMQVQCATPRDAAAILRMNEEIDVRHVLGSLHVPTLVLHRTGDQITRVAAARYMAEHIPDAQLVELPGDDHVHWVGDTEKLLGSMEEFLTGSRRKEEEPDRVLATVLFTDIVDSTARAVEMGDRRWRDLLGDHHSLVRKALTQNRGREVDTAGDGFFATFDGPARAIRCAREIVASVRSLGIEVRAGLHTGECELHENGVAGIAVHIGSRVVGLAGGGEVLVSSTVKDLVAGSGIEFAARGGHALKGIPGEWQIFEVAA